MRKLLDKYINEACPLCNNKETNPELCNITIYEDYKTNEFCCKCINFISENNINSEIKQK